jgi:hypothetical protein
MLCLNSERLPKRLEGRALIQLSAGYESEHDLDRLRLPALHQPALHLPAPLLTPQRPRR